MYKNQELMIRLNIFCLCKKKKKEIFYARMNTVLQFEWMPCNYKAEENAWN